MLAHTVRKLETGAKAYVDNIVCVPSVLTVSGTANVLCLTLHQHSEAHYRKKLDSLTQPLTLIST